MTNATNDNEQTDHETDKPRTARAIASPVIQFGLVSIPVRVYTSQESADEIEFNNLHALDGGRLKQQMVCTACDAVVAKEEMVKGHEHAKGRFVTFTAAELKQLEAASTNTIRLVEFVPEVGGVDLLWIEKSYYLGPDKGSDVAYRLLERALSAEHRIGIGVYAAKGKEIVVAIARHVNGLAMHELRRGREVKDWTEVPGIPGYEVDLGQLAMARRLVAAQATLGFAASSYADVAHERLRSMIEAKVAGKEFVVPPAAGAAASSGDLMSALADSLAAIGAPPIPVTDPEPRPVTGPEPRPRKKRAAAAAGKKTASKPTKRKRAA